MNTLHQAVIAADSAVDAILNEGAEILYLKHINELAKPFSMNFLAELVLNSVEQSFIRREIFEEDSWPEDQEILPSGIDNWARNAIPVKQRFIASPQEILLMPAADARSIKSFKSGRSTRSALGKRVQKRASILSKNAGTIGEDPQAFPIAIPPSSMSDLEETLRVKKENEFKKKSEEAERMQKIKDEMDEKERRIKKESAEMRKKIITYDCNGNIIYVNHPRYDAIPKLYSEVEIIEEKKNELPPLALNSKNRKKIEESRVKTAPVRELDWVKNMHSIGPSLFEVIKLNQGVSIGDGFTTKYSHLGHSASQRTFTRKDYERYTNPQMKNQANSLASMDKKSQDSFKSGSRLGSRRDFLEEIPEYDGIDQLQESDEFEASVKEKKKIVKVKSFSNVSLAKENPIEKFNQDIKKNKQWGVNPSIKKPLIIEKIRKKPGEKEMKDIYGDLIKKPKDQPFVTFEELWENAGNKIKKPRDRPGIEKIDKKSRPPPPPYGFTMVNALPDYEEWMKSGQDANYKY